MRISLFLIVLILISACKKPENRSCFKFNGENTTKEIPLEPFDRLNLMEHMEFVLIQDSLDKVVLKGGKNILNLIEIKNEGGLVTIKNNNKCPWLRNAKKGLIVVEIHLTRLVNINFVGTEPMRSQGTIKTDYFTYYSRDGVGDVVLDLDALHIDAEADHGWGNYTLTGKTKSARICAKSNSYCDVSGLIVQDSIYIMSETAGDMKVNANGVKLNGYLRESGDVFYKGTPLSVSVLLNGTGSLLPL